MSSRSNLPFLVFKRIVTPVTERLCIMTHQATALINLGANGVVRAPLIGAVMG